MLMFMTEGALLPAIHVLSRRALAWICSRLPLRFLLYVRRAYLDEGRSTPGWRCSRALLGVARMRGIPAAGPFRVAGHATMRMVPSDSRIAARLFWLGIHGHEAGEPAWWATLVSSHRSVLELGANIGVYTLAGAVADPSARYVAVEPNPASVEVLRHNLAVNGLEHVEVVPAAVVGDRAATDVSLRFPDRDRYAASAGAFVDGALDLDTPATRAVTVPTVAVADLVHGVDLLKLDIEGVEAEVLASVRPWIVDTTPTIVVEVRDDAEHLQQVLGDLLDETDYACYAVSGGEPKTIDPRAVTEGRLQRDHGTRDVTLIPLERATACRVPVPEEPTARCIDRRRRVAGFYQRVLPRFRRRRMRLLADTMQVGPRTRVLDVGGTPLNWGLLDGPPAVTVLNLDGGHVIADGCRLPFRTSSFDLVFSNSTIEHVGSLASQGMFAAEARRVGKSYFVQTPNRSFPFEPHLLTPFVQFLPHDVRLRLARNFTVWGWLVRPPIDVVRNRVGRIRLLSSREMQALFPDADVHRERWLGLTKSLIAIGGRARSRPPVARGVASNHHPAPSP
jgi:FkbM family methyltransferase